MPIKVRDVLEFVGALRADAAGLDAAVPGGERLLWRWRMADLLEGVSELELAAAIRRARSGPHQN